MRHATSSLNDLPAAKKFRNWSSQEPGFEIWRTRDFIDVTMLVRREVELIYRIVRSKGKDQDNGTVQIKTVQKHSSFIELDHNILCDNFHIFLCQRINHYILFYA